MRIIVTDFTEFHNPNFHCIAGICPDGRCLRPTENYFTKGECAHLNILAGTVLEGDFLPLARPTPPHTEDCRRRNVHFASYCRAEEFRALLEADLAASVEEGFDLTLPEDNTRVPRDTPPGRSIITVRIGPRQGWFTMVKGAGLCFSFTDADGRKFVNLPVRDLKICEKAAGPTDRTDHLNIFLHRQTTLYLRVGLGRDSGNGRRTGYPLELNGIYTFPQWIHGTRGFVEG